jgi:hypothetical protein
MSATLEAWIGNGSLTAVAWLAPTAERSRGRDTP